MNSQDFYRRFLPHWHPPNATFFVTFRLEGSLPKSVIDLFQQEYELAKRLLDSLPAEKRSQERYDAYKKAYARYEAALDKANGPRWLAKSEIAEVVKKEIHALHPEQYHLIAYCVMPNHVHLLVDMQDIPDPPPRKNGTRYTALAYALWLLKGRTGHACQSLLGREGRFWARESYDHVVRDEEEFVRVLAYIVNNPVKAGLVRNWREWPHTFVEESYQDLV
jgi:REP element-mobilizing transposase RayT